MKTFYIILMSLLLVACAPQSLKDSQSKLNNDALTLLNSAHNHVGLLQKKDTQYIGTSKSSFTYAPSLPDVFSRKITLTKSSTINLNDLPGELIAAQSGSSKSDIVPVIIMPQLKVDANNNPLSQALSNTSSIGSSPIASLPGNIGLPQTANNVINDLLSRGGGEQLTTDTVLRPVKFIGQTFKSVLDDICAANNLDWKYLNGKVVIYRYLTKTIRINVLPGTSTFTTAITKNGNSTISSGSSSGGVGAIGGQGGSGGSSGGSGSEQITKLDAQKLDIWETLKNTLPTMLSNQGMALVNPALGTVTIRDEPIVVQEVSKYIEDVNRSMSKQVAIDVTLYLVTLTDSSQVGINWSAAFNEGNGNLFLNGNSILVPQAAAGSAALSFLIPNTATDPNLKNYAGSQLLLNALNSIGTVTNKYSIPVRTQNLQPVQIGNRQQQVYLAQSGSTQTANVGTSSTNIPGILTTGLELALIPHILDDNSISIQYGVTLSASSGIRTITSGNGTIEAPEVGISDFVGRVSMSNNQTLVMSGLEQLTTRLDENGNIASGGGWVSNGRHVVLVLSLTPRLEASYTYWPAKSLWPFNYLTQIEAV